MKVTESDFTEAFPAFKGSGRLAEEILKAARTISFPGGFQLFSEGDQCQGIAFLLSGSVRVYKSGASGREITLYEIERGETCILNASCILSSAGYPANATSLEEGEALLVPSNDFLRLMEQYPEMRMFVFRVLTERLSNVMALVEEIAFGRLEERLLDYLIEKSEDGKLISTHQKVANDLGTSREVVSRILKDLERRGAVSLARNSITLLKQLH